jgi:hypothetical protein
VHPPSQALVSEILNTNKARDLSDETRRSLAYIVYDYLIQLELTSISGGITNREIFNSKYDAYESWKSPSFFMRYEVLNQYQIIASRSAMEVLIDILHLIESGKKIRSGKSKLKAFRKWLCDSENPFHYFAMLLLTTYKFDRELRSPEIHGNPRSARRILQLERPDNREVNRSNELSNALINSWNPLIEILNGIKPRSMYIPEEYDFSWLETYLNGNDDEVNGYLKEMFQAYQ